MTILKPIYRCIITAFALVASSAFSASAQSPIELRPGVAQLAARPSSMADEILAAHNQYRREVGVPDLVWSDELAQDAQGWSDHLAAQGTLEHSQERNGAGENLWMGSSGRYSWTAMVQGWGEEKQYFRMGNFPDVSTTGNWVDVGHYTQLVWRDTREVGCAKASGGGNDVLTCRYRSPGNYMGQRPY
jgi:Cysteine-rich secretory protein family